MNYNLFIYIGAGLIAGSIVPLVAQDKPSSAPAQPKAASTVTVQKAHVKILEEARQDQRAGNVSSALPKYREAIESAERAGDTEQQASARIEKARVLESRSVIDPADRKARDEAVEDYKTAISIGTPNQQAQAKCNLGALLVRDNKPKEAIQVLKDVDSKSLSANQHVILRMNLASAYEMDGHSQAALVEYKQAIAQNPSFEKPVEGAFRLLYQSDSPRLREAYDLGTNLLARGQPELAARHLRHGLHQYPNHPQAEYLLAGLVRCYAAIGLTPSAFQGREAPFLSNLAESTNSLAKAVNELKFAFTGRLKPAFSPSEVRERFPFWSEAPQRAQSLSLLLKKIGDYYSETPSSQGSSPPRSNIPGALGCYSTAWALDSQNLEAALYTAAVLRDHAESIDAGGELMTRFIRKLFDAKGNRYAVQLKTEGDWQNILRCHLVLTTIYEQAGAWGPEQRDDPENVIFQLGHAVTAESELRKMNPKLEPSPGLYMRLGQACARTDQKPRAWEFYLQAAEGFLHYSRKASARDALNEAEKLNVQIDRKNTIRYQTAVAASEG